ncbi:type II toxin-antitoxin system Phd/YefM family antitoxin [Paralysiella testudinis]|uniref:Antitoxin n=1 Tax=Paralysiella testudinis TaxID=2809020 RepID=A0A892ZEV9_9NEIS|nr:type II toxin-antitoxin system Phd/YefM family antitoxin [Paralysiella testudinis]QRQ81482.1 type II toxin-antitoxin system Phd/YefM family antitoxin [Paralysiella testudinis]
MQIFTAKDAKTHFGAVLDLVQREPVLITRNNRPAGVFVSIEDLEGTYLADLLMEKEAGYDEWVSASTQDALAKHRANPDTGIQAGEIHQLVMQKVRAKIGSK